VYIRDDVAAETAVLVTECMSYFVVSLLNKVLLVTRFHY